MEKSESCTNELEKCLNFEEFFIEICKLKVKANVKELRELRKIVTHSKRFSLESRIYLSDCIDIEIVDQMQSEKANGTNESESDMKKKVVKNFNNMFPNYEFVKEEFMVPTGRIDIFAHEKQTNRPVVI
jgi:RecB family endonuclease NucS